MKKFFQEFKEFALKGNVMDMAIGVIIGAAFKGIVDSLTNDLINPLIGLLFNADFSDVSIRLTDSVSLGVGAFISTVINFIIMAFVLFCIVKAMNKLMSLGHHAEDPAPEAPAAPTQEELLADILQELKAQNTAKVD